MTQKIAVTLPNEQVVSIRRAVEQGRAPSVSGFISAAVARMQREDDLAQLLDDLDRELGPVDAADMAWADKALGRLLQAPPAPAVSGRKKGEEAAVRPRAPRCRRAASCRPARCRGPGAWRR